MNAMIFDLDGTLLDSMNIWEKFALHYLMRLKKTPEPHLIDHLRCLTLKEAAEYLNQHYDLNMTCEQIEQGFSEQLFLEYEQVTCKNGVVSFLETCQQKQLPMCVFTANQYDLTIHTLRRLGILSYFKEVITCETCGSSKQDIASYAYVAMQLQCPLEQCIVIEDALHAIQTAKQAGCTVWAMYDPANDLEWPQICSLADESFKQYQEMEGKICRLY